MPQLDVGIISFELFMNFLFFWTLYFYKAKKILPLLNKTIKLRKYKLKKINNNLNFFKKNYSFSLNFSILKHGFLNNFILSILDEINKEYFNHYIFIYALYENLYFDFHWEKVNFLRKKILLKFLTKKRWD